MVISSRRTAALRLRTAVDALRAEQKNNLADWALELLDRLANSAEAAQAFEELKLKDWHSEHAFLMLCILVKESARTFPTRISISTDKEMLTRLKRLDKAITDLRSFVDEKMKQHLVEHSDLLIPQFDPLPAWGWVTTMAFPDPFEAANAMMRGLHLIAELIEKQRNIGKTVMTKFLAPRKRHIKKAPNIIAIKFLAEGMRKLTGKPHKEQLRILAPVIFGAELSDESVIYALRAPKRARSRGRKSA